MGFEPILDAWRAPVLPLHQYRIGTTGRIRTFILRFWRAKCYHYTTSAYGARRGTRTPKPAKAACFQDKSFIQPDYVQLKMEA